LTSSLTIVVWQWGGLEKDDIGLFGCRADVISAADAQYRDNKKHANIVIGSQLFRFANELQLTDQVISYDPRAALYWMGAITGGYEYSTKLSSEAPHTRQVEWTGSVDRQLLSTKTRYGLCGPGMLFKVRATMLNELCTFLNDREWNTLEEKHEISQVRMIEGIEANLRNRVISMEWDEVQALVAGLLRSLGYRTKIRRGADGGVDVEASLDGLGLKTPRIMVQVRHRQQATTAEDIRAFVGGRHRHDRALFVSTGGFTKDARYEADRAAIPLTLLGIDDLIDQISQHYDHFDVEGRMLLPLRKMYVPDTLSP